MCVCVCEYFDLIVTFCSDLDCWKHVLNWLMCDQWIPSIIRWVFCSPMHNLF